MKFFKVKRLGPCDRIWVRYKLQALASVWIMMAVLVGVVALNEHLREQNVKRIEEEMRQKLTIGSMQSDEQALTKDSATGRAIEPNGFTAAINPQYAEWSPLQRWLFERRLHELAESDLILKDGTDLRGVPRPNGAVWRARSGQAPFYEKIPIA